jgi:hypothetical protein
MDNTRLKELAGYKIIAEGFISISKFKGLPENERHKLLWQWAQAQQMKLNEWQEYLVAHCEEVVTDYVRELRDFE